jgi:RimJ/RimL family protein N-acetyltransferase
MGLEKITLEGKYVRLEPMAPGHHDGLCEAVSDGELWNLEVTLVPHPRDMRTFMSTAEEGFASGRELPFVIIDKTSQRVAGSTRFLNIEMPHKNAEIGYTFLGQSWQRTAANTESKLLLLQHAFDGWGMNRVQFLTDVRNERSRNAILRLGAKEEGVLRSHMIMRGGRVRDSILFSIISEEWPEVEKNLRKKLASGETPRVS